MNRRNFLQSMLGLLSFIPFLDLSLDKNTESEDFFYVDSTNDMINVDWALINGDSTGMIMVFHHISPEEFEIMKRHYEKTVQLDHYDWKRIPNGEWIIFE